MVCLLDFIGIEGCAEPASESGYYINRLLPGISLESIDKIAQADQVTFKGVWDDVQHRAALLFEADCIKEFSSRYQIRNISESFDLLKFIDKVNDQTALAAKWRGFTIQLIQSNAYRWVQSALQCINLQSIRIYRKEATAAVNGKVFNLETGEVLTTFTIPLNTVAGWTEVAINRRFFAYRVFVAFDSTAVNCVKLDIQTDIINKFNACACDFFYEDCEAAIKGAESATLSAEVLDADITEGYNLFGLSGVFSIGCSYHSIVCQNKLQFLMPWAFCLGRELMWERAYTNRLNRYTIGIDAAKARELMADFDAHYREQRTTVIDGINLDTMDCCLQCNAMVQVRENIM